MQGFSNHLVCLNSAPASFLSSATSNQQLMRRAMQPHPTFIFFLIIRYIQMYVTIYGRKYLLLPPFHDDFNTPFLDLSQYVHL